MIIITKDTSISTLPYPYVPQRQTGYDGPQNLISWHRFW